MRKLPIILLIIIMPTWLACCPAYDEHDDHLAWPAYYAMLAEPTATSAEINGQGGTETGQGDGETPGNAAPPTSSATRSAPEKSQAPEAPMPGSGIVSRELQAVWPQGTYQVGLTHEQDGLAFTVREMHIEAEALGISWEAVNLSERAVALKTENGQPPLLQDNTGRIYEYPAWPEGETLAIEPGEKVAGEWRFGLPAFDAYRMRLGINLLRSVVPVALPGKISFWTEPWSMPNPDWPQREEGGQAEDVCRAKVGKLAVAVRSVRVEATHVAIDVAAALGAGEIEEAVTLTWTTKPELRGSRRYVLDEWSLDDRPSPLGQAGAVLPGQTWQAELVFYPAPPVGEALTLVFNPNPVLENQPTAVLEFVAP